MTRRSCIKHTDNLFAPVEEADSREVKDAMVCLPFLGFLIGCTVWMWLDVMGVIGC